MRRWAAVVVLTRSGDGCKKTCVKRAWFCRYRATSKATVLQADYLAITGEYFLFSPVALVPVAAISALLVGRSVSLWVWLAVSSANSPTPGDPADVALQSAGCDVVRVKVPYQPPDTLPIVTADSSMAAYNSGTSTAYPSLRRYLFSNCLRSSTNSPLRIRVLRWV